MRGFGAMAVLRIFDVRAVLPDVKVNVPFTDQLIRQVLFFHALNLNSILDPSLFFPPAAKDDDALAAAMGVGCSKGVPSSGEKIV